MEIQVNVQDWLALPMATRLKLRQIFSVPKSKGSLVEGNVVKSDGTTHDDLKHITVKKMQEYLLEPEEENFVTLFNRVAEHIQTEIEKEIPLPEKIDPTMVILEEWSAHLGRMTMQAQNLGLTEHLRIIFNKLLPNPNDSVKRQPTGETNTSAPTPTNPPAAKATRGSTKASKQQGAEKGSTTAESVS